MSVMGDWLGPEEHEVRSAAAATPQLINRVEIRVEVLALGIWSPV
jgi:hypothetical protein